MVECVKCKKTGLKIRDMITTFVDGKSAFMCKDCAKTELGMQEPRIYFKKL